MEKFSISSLALGSKGQEGQAAWPPPRISVNEMCWSAPIQCSCGGRAAAGGISSLKGLLWAFVKKAAYASCALTKYQSVWHPCWVGMWVVDLQSSLQKSWWLLELVVVFFVFFLKQLSLESLCRTAACGCLIQDFFGSAPAKRRLSDVSSVKLDSAWAIPSLVVKPPSQKFHFQQLPRKPLSILGSTNWGPMMWNDGVSCPF